MYKYCIPIHNGALLPDTTAMAETADAREIAERCGDDFSLDSARLSHGMVLVTRAGPYRPAGLKLLAQYREACLRHRYTTDSVRWVDIETVNEKVRAGDVDGAIELARVVVDFPFTSGEMTTRGPAVTARVESLLRRGADPDLAEAKAANDRLAAVRTDPGFVLHELPLLRLRALLARAHGDKPTYEEFRDRYRSMAESLGFEGHIAIAHAMS